MYYSTYGNSLCSNYSSKRFDCLLLALSMPVLILEGLGTLPVQAMEGKFAISEWHVWSLTRVGHEYSYPRTPLDWQAVRLCGLLSLLSFLRLGPCHAMTDVNPLHAGVGPRFPIHACERIIEAVYEDRVSVAPFALATLSTCASDDILAEYTKTSLT